MSRRVMMAAVAAIGVIGVIGISQTPGVAQGGKHRVKAVLNGYQEDPSVSSTGHGTFEAVIHEYAGVIDYVLSYQNLEGASTLAAHIHFGGHDHNGGVSVFLCGGGGKPACPAGSGSVADSIDPADVIGPAAQGIAAGEFAELIAAIRAGHTYVNVHTNKHPGGEIRGQIANENQREERR